MVDAEIDVTAAAGGVAREEGGAYLDVIGVEKTFGRVRALHPVDLRVEHGTIHALIGANGAGKSTLLGIIAGRIAPSSGTVLMGGAELPVGNPHKARAAGVAAIYQELTIVPQLSTQANVFLGNVSSRRGLLRERQMREQYRALCARLGVAAHPDTPAGDLSVAQQQVLEVLRGVVLDARLLLLDEPTAALASHEREILFALMRDLRAAGTTIIFVSHNLDEVLAVADHVTVFKDGRVAAELPAAGTSKRELITAMLGRPTTELVSVRESMHDSAVALEVTGLRRPGSDHAIDLRVHRGEVLGIGGLVGSGRSALLKTLIGALPASGRMTVNGREGPLPSSPHRARRLGIVTIPEDRKAAGLFASMSAADNILVSDYRTVSKLGWVSGRLARRQSAAAARAAGFDLNRLSAPASTLSGGNQQKLLFARWSHFRPAVLLADEPTRGIDVGGKEQILNHLVELAASGLAVIVVSSEIEEIVPISHRVLVMARGAAVAMLNNYDGNLTANDVVQTAFQFVEAES